MELREIRMAMADRVELAGRLYLPDGEEPHPVVVMSHGFSGLMDMGLDPYARAFQVAGLACLVYDHRNFGDSGGSIRQEVDPWQQIRDMREVIAHARIQEVLDADTGIVDPIMAAEAVSTSFLQYILKGLQKSPKIITDQDALHHP